MIDPRDTRRILAMCLEMFAAAEARTLHETTFGVARM